VKAGAKDWRGTKWLAGEATATNGLNANESGSVAEWLTAKLANSRTTCRESSKCVSLVKI
jgi:hypothetical protein